MPKDDKVKKHPVIEPPPDPHPHPEPHPDPHPKPDPHPEPVPVPHPKPHPEPDPEPHPKPHPKPHHEPHAVTVQAFVPAMNHRRATHCAEDIKASIDTAMAGEFESHYTNAGETVFICHGPQAEPLERILGDHLPSGHLRISEDDGIRRNTRTKAF